LLPRSLTKLAKPEKVADKVDVPEPTVVAASARTRRLKKKRALAAGLDPSKRMKVKPTG
jgi:hypothetical protein